MCICFCLYNISMLETIVVYQFLSENESEFGMFHLKRNDNKFDRDGEVDKSKTLFAHYDLAEVWLQFKYRIDKAPAWSNFDFEQVVFSHER